MMIDSPQMEAQRALRERLGPEEQILWAGRPLSGIRLQPSDAFAIPFSVMWGGFAIFWEASVLTSRAPLFFCLWGIPFVLVGLYLIAGRFFYDAWQREKTLYALTNQRVLIIQGWKVQSFALATLDNINLTEGRDGTGTISLGASSSAFSWGWPGIRGWPGTQNAPALILLPSAGVVYNRIMAAQHELHAGQR